MLGVITSQAVPGRSGVTLLARLQGQSGALVTQASLSSITWTLTDLTTGLAAGSGTFTVGSVIFDSLQQDGLWGKDSAVKPGADKRWGYNFKAVLPAASMVPAGDTFQADVAFTPASGEAFRVSFKVPTLKVYG